MTQVKSRLLPQRGRRTLKRQHSLRKWWNYRQWPLAAAQLLVYDPAHLSKIYRLASARKTAHSTQSSPHSKRMIWVLTALIMVRTWAAETLRLYDLQHVVYPPLESTRSHRPRKYLLGGVWLQGQITAVSAKVRTSRVRCLQGFPP